MIIVPIGTNASFKKETNKSSFSLPFDWMFAPPSFVYQMLVLLLEKNINIEDLVKNHFFHCDKRASVNGLENYYTCKNGIALYNTKYDAIFPHDHDINTETINKYIRRFERLKFIIYNYPEELYFTYSSQSSLESGNFRIDGRHIVNNPYFFLSCIHDLIGKFRTNYKLVVFDTIQNEDVNILNKKIILCKLDKCNNWIELLNQMKPFTFIFN